MTPRSLPIVAVLLCGLSAACYPAYQGQPRAYGEYARVSEPIPADESATPPPAPDQASAAGSRAGAAFAPAPRPAAAAAATPTATRATNRDGYVVSPHSGQLVLVRGVPSGVVVPDNTAPGPQKKFFRVP